MNLAALSALALLAFAFFSPVNASSGEVWLSDHGGVCDNATDDRAALADAIAAAGAIGGTVRLPPGHCRISAGVTVPASVVVLGIVGSGKSSSHLRFESGGIVWEAQYAQPRFSDFAMTCSAASVCITLGSTTTGPTQGVLRNIRILGGGVGFRIYNSTDMRIQDNDLFFCKFYCVHLESPANPDMGDSVMSGNHMLGSGGSEIGVYHGSGGGWKVFGNKIISFYVAYYLHAQTDHRSISATLIQNNSFEGCGLCILIQPRSLGGGQLYNTVITGNQLAAKAGGSCFQSQSGGLTWIRSFIFSANMCRGTSQGHGFYFDGISKFSISGNLANDASGGSYGFAFGGSIGAGSVTGNVATNFTTKYGVIPGHVLTSANY